MLRVTGDCHNKINELLSIIPENGVMLQIGDLSFQYDFLDSVSSNKFRFFCGNHDNIDKAYNYPHCLGKFGYHLFGGVAFFHLSGAFSIDWQMRIKHEQKTGEKVWWENEQLSYKELEQALEMYSQIKPDLVIAHDAPRSVVRKVFDGNILKGFGYDPDTFTTHTSEALETMINIHKPKTFIHGHYHKNVKTIIDDVEYICLDELNYIDIG